MCVRERACVRVQGSQIIRNPIIPEGAGQRAADLLHKANRNVFFIRSHYDTVLGWNYQR